MHDLHSPRVQRGPRNTPAGRRKPLRQIPVFMGSLEHVGTSKMQFGGGTFGRGKGCPHSSCSVVSWGSFSCSGMNTTVPGSRCRDWDLRAPYPQRTWSTIGGHPGSNGSPPTVKALASRNASHPVPMLCHLSATCVTGAKPCVVTYVLSGDRPPA